MKVKVGFAVALFGILTVWLGRAALAYYADVSICLSPVKIVSHQERIETAVAFVQRPDGLKWAERLGDPEAVEALRQLDPRTCCQIVRRGSVGENGISFYGILMGKTSHGVNTGIRLPLAGIVRIGTTICGNIDRSI